MMRLKYNHLFLVVILMLTAVIPVTAQNTLPDHPLLPAGLHFASGPIPTDLWAVVVQPEANPDTLATQLGYDNFGAVSGQPNTYLFRVANSSRSPQDALIAAQKFERNSQILQFIQQAAYQQFPRDPADDPLNAQPDPFQWHLFVGTSRVPPWLNIHIQSAWNAGFTGTGVQIAIVDDGLQYTHRDIAPNYFAAGSYDFNGNDNDPAPVTTGTCATTANCHGTAVAGVAGAADNPPPGGPSLDHDFCGVGVAYGANVSGIRLIAAPSTDLMESNALKYIYGNGGNTTGTNDIYSNSWGPADDGATLRAPGPLTWAAIVDGITNGRGGLGNIYVWAGGNGRAYYAQPSYLTYIGDNVNADGYANSRYVIAVAAAGPNGTPAYYSEAGAPLLVTAPSSDNMNGIATTDLMGAVGYGSYPSGDDCTLNFGGTSAAAPVVTGVVALMLQANPSLTWRDVQHILVDTAFKPDVYDDTWVINYAGHNVSSRYGFGVVDASAAVNLAQSWTNVASEISYASPVITVNRRIPSSAYGSGQLSSVVIPANIKVEHVEVIFNAVHSWRGDIEVNLTAPSGTVSQLMNQRPFDGYLNWPTTIIPDPNYTNWKFTTVRNWDEFGGGTWTLEVVDRKPSQDIGTFQNWQIIVYGTPTTPKSPVPIAPINNLNSSLPVTPVTFKWNTETVFQSDHLELQLDTPNLPTNTINIPGAPTSVVVNLSIGTYDWRVRTVSAVSGISDWSSTQSFTIGTDSNAAPVRNFYANNTAILTWSLVTRAARYEIQIDDVATFSSPLQPTIVVSGNINTVTTPLTTGVWYWRIRSCESLMACTGAWSPAESIVVTP